MSTEQQFAYNGPLSTYSEAHSLLIGLAAGLLAGWSKPIRSDFRDEPYSAIGGFLVGVAAGTILRGD
jgi:hypothetical protein